MYLLQIFLLKMFYSLICHCRSGSVVVDMTLVYKDKNSVPAATTATTALSKELSSSTTLNVVAGSVSARKLLETHVKLNKSFIYESI